MSPPTALLLSILVILALPSTRAQPPGDASAVLLAISRTLNLSLSSTAATFDLSIDPDLCTAAQSPCFVVDAAAASGDAGGPVQVKVVGTRASELGYGVGWYLKTFANMSFAWERAGGNQVQLPVHGAWPATGGAITKTKKKPWSYYQNVCTGSYSMWWWRWTRWEREIDWMLLHGVNIALA